MSRMGENVAGAAQDLNRGFPAASFAAYLHEVAARELMKALLEQNPAALDWLVKHTTDAVRRRFADAIGRPPTDARRCELILAEVSALELADRVGTIEGLHRAWANDGRRAFVELREGDRLPPVGVLVRSGPIELTPAALGRLAAAADDHERLGLLRSLDPWAIPVQLPPPEAMHGAEVTPDERTPEQRDREAGIP